MHRRFALPQARSAEERKVCLIPFAMNLGKGILSFWKIINQLNKNLHYGQHLFCIIHELLQITKLSVSPKQRESKVS